MLQTKVLEPGTLDLLKELMFLPSLQQFNLVGGTALALQFGHRHSIDLDFFGDTKEFNHTLIDSELKSLGEVQLISSSRVMLGYFVREVKVDVVKYSYPLLFPLVELESMRLAAPEDIAAMKIAAIANRGHRKDFYDLYALLQKFSFAQIFKWYNEKFPDGNPMLSHRSLTYFHDADQEEDPILFMDVSWQEVKQDIRTKQKKFLGV